MTTAFPAFTPFSSTAAAAMQFNFAFNYTPHPIAAGLTTFGDKIPPERRAQFVQLFNNFDPMRTNSLGASEFAALLASIGYQFSQSGLNFMMALLADPATSRISLNNFLEFCGFAMAVESIFARFDPTGQKRIHCSTNFASLIASLNYGFNAGQLQILYRIVKQDTYGYMSSTDFLEACTFMLLCEALFRKADADRSGTLEFNEAVLLLPQFNLQNAPVSHIKQLFDMNSVNGKMSLETFICLAVLLLSGS